MNCFRICFDIHTKHPAESDQTVTLGGVIAMNKRIIQVVSAALACL